MKQKLLSIFQLRAVMFVALICAAFTSAWAADETITFNKLYSSNTILDGTTINGTNFSVVFNKRTGGTATQYYTNGSSVRWYGGGTLQISSTTKTIEKVEITFTQNANTVTTDVGEYSSGTWTGSSNSIKFTQSGTSGHCRISAIAVTYAPDASKITTTTTFDGEESYTVLMGEEFTSPTATVSPDGLDPIYSSSNTAVATVDDKSGEVTVLAAGTTTITATYEGDETYAPSSDSYTLTVVPVYATLEALAADGTLVSGDIVNVSFQNVEIKSVYVSSAQKRQGIYFDIQKGDKDIEIYYSAEEVPETWVAGGTVSGTMQCPWKNYNGTWELAPDYNTWSWDNLEYVAPAGAKTTATIEFTANSKLGINTVDEYDVTYNGDGTLQVSSSDENVATVAIEASHVVVTAIAAGTTVITVSAPETDEYTEASKQYTLSVTQPFDRNVHKALVAEKDGKYFAAYNTIEGSNTYFAVKEVTVYNNKVYFQNDEDASDIAWNITIDDTDATKATVQNLDGDYLVLGTKTAVSLSSNENELYANEDGGFYYSSTGRGFGYNSGANPTRMAGYSISNTYPVAKAMSFAGDEDAPMRITSAGWATFYAPFPVAIPEGVTAYTGTMMDDWIQLNELTEGCIPAATGVVVAKAVEGDAFVASLTPVDFVPSVPVVSCYIGNTSNANMEVEIGDYLLQKQNDVVGWYQVQGEGFKLAPYRCYLPNFQANSSRSFIGFEPVDDATGISSIATEAKTKADGKYMVKGQIVVVKAGKAYYMNGTEVK